MSYSALVTIPGEVRSDTLVGRLAHFLMPIPLSTRCEKVAARLFDEPQCTHVKKRLLTEASENIPFHENSDSVGMDRIRFSIMKLVSSPGTAEDPIFELAKRDWRDLFVAAGFGYSADEHNKWYQELFEDTPA